MLCPYCGNDRGSYHGIDDGGGDFGTSLVEVYECLDCGSFFDVDVYDYGLIDDPQDDNDQTIDEVGL